MSVVLLFIDFLAIIVCLVIIKQITGEKRLLSLNATSLLFYKEFVAYSLVGSTIVLMGYGKSYYNFFLMSDQTLQYKTWLLVVYAMVTFFVTLYFLDYLSKRKLTDILHSLVEEPKTNVNYNNAKIWVCIVTAICLMYYIFYCRKVGYIPFTKLFLGSPYELETLRYQDKFEFEGNSIIKNQCLFVIPYLSSYTAYLSMNITKDVKWKLIFAFAFLTAIICLTSRFEKGFLIIYLLGYVVLPTKVEFKGKRSKLRKGVMLVAVGIFGIAYVMFVSQGVLTGLAGQINSIYRVIFSQIAGTYAHLLLFPSSIDFLDFQYYPGVVADIFGNQEIRSARIVMQYFGTSSNGGYMNSLFVAEAYANGGMIAAMVSPIIVAISFYVTLRIFNILADTPLKKAALVYIIIKLPITGGYLDFIYSSSMILLFALVIILNYCIEKIVIKARSS